MAQDWDTSKSTAWGLQVEAALPYAKKHLLHATCKTEQDIHHQAIMSEMVSQDIEGKKCA